MKIYQVIEHGGSYEDSYTIVENTFLYKEKAFECRDSLESTLSEAKDMVDNCWNCRVRFTGSKNRKDVLKALAKVSSNCKYADLKLVDEGDESNPYYVIVCENDVSWCEDIYGYTIKEYEVTI